MRSHTLFCGMRQRGQWWFRVFGRGVSYKNTALHPLVFSERNDYVRGLAIGRHYFTVLMPLPDPPKT